jgi:hypothetical protein
MICILSNTDARPIPCPLCHCLVLPAVGPQLALLSTQEPVCMDCAAEHEPELANLLRLARSAETYANDLAAAAGLQS